MKGKLLFTIQLISLHLFAQSPNNQTTTTKVLKGKYFGLELPGMTAELFAKDIVSTESVEHSAPAFSPDGTIVVWGVVERDKPAYLLEMKQENGVWSQAAPPSFANSAYDDFYPRFSPDGKKLYFSSRRPLPKGFSELNDMWIWVVERKGKGWNEPVPMDSTLCEGTEYAHSVSEKGTIYFSFRKQEGKIFDIGYSNKVGDHYEKPKALSNEINTSAIEDGPYIAPDESFLIFESSRPGGLGSNDLYICFKEKNGAWSQPINMGPKVNTLNSERFAGLSPDGKILFFGSDRNGPDIYWISAKVIDELKLSK